MTRPLARRRFLVTRPENQSDRLTALLLEAGAEPLLAPMIAIGEAAEPAALDAALTRLDDYDLAVFISPTALDQVGARVQRWPTELPAAVIGPASRERAHELGILDVISPDSRFDSEGLLEHPAMQRMEGRRVVLFRGNGGRELLAETLAARGAKVNIVEAYRRLPPTMAREELATLLAGGCDGVIVTSSEAVQNLFSLCDEPLTDLLRSTLFFASHPAIAEAARRNGVSSVFTTAAGDTGIVASLSECFAGSNVATTPTPPPRPAMEPPRKAVRPRSTGQWRWALGGAAIAIGVSLAWQHLQRQDMQAEMDKQLSQLEGRLGLLTAGERRDGGRMSQLDARLATIDHRIGELQARQDDQQALYGAIMGDQEETLLADAELTLSLASQQLQLTGNVGAALAALYRLDERLAGHDQPRLLPLRRALARDLDALKRMPWIDYVGLSARLDSLAGGIDKLPLAVDAKSTEDQVQPDADKRKGLLGDLSRALGALVEIRRIDQPDPVLLAPEQAVYLREQIKLRLLNARLALLQRDEITFRRDLQAADGTLRKHFDTRSKPVVATLATLRELQAAQPAQVLPSLSDSLNAARDARRKVSREEGK
ncbi:uroporphyrinogen-III C-methyltransferase [Chitinimonas viridis]|uniref:Uroporphyrinogen-III C-methyltransferase n=1 Tax=Chitinimonas viridis TaxID=664880 RepID=A0ABT8B6I9_9NEIS|nr:uroporphyrinogen-III C-methyltransferase [Chitinimonas viridis]MDN3577869.1 uroporphyrinogen-III C-methyltransferase [Chitinimonas viridis]